ncbi:hypothetical protein LZ639_22245, partial [Pseudomonas stutzeri]|uniref:hypothetical protein n=1 Tax=Stutzerimonas stutzeri TaxID=316 RepID=UPI001F3C53B9
VYGALTAQKPKLSWFSRSNVEIERFLSCRKAALSKTDFFNRIGRSLPVVTKACAGQVECKRLVSLCN